MYSKGISWINDCRIPYDGEIPNLGGRAKHTRGDGYGFNALQDNIEANTQGRFPANILVSDDMLNDGVVSKSTIFDGKLPNIKGGRFGASDVELTDKRAFGGYDDKGSSSRYYNIDKWFENLIN